MPNGDKKVTVQEFSKSIKDKYPQYKDVDDVLLANKMIEKYPQYKDRVAFEPVKKKEPSQIGGVPSKQETPQYDLHDVLSGKHDFSQLALPSYFHEEKKVKTPSGKEFNIDKVPYASDAESVNQLQKRINEGNPSEDDINHLAQSTGKSKDVINAYIKKGNEAGVLTENAENLGKIKNDLEETIKNYNKHFGTNYTPDDVLSNGEKAAQFLDALKIGERDKLALDAKFKAGFKGYEKEFRNIQPHDLLSPQDFLSKSNEYKKLISNQVVDLTVAEGGSKEQVLNKIAQRINPKGYKLYSEAVSSKYMPSVGTDVQEGASALGEMYDRLVGNEKKVDETLNSVVGLADVEYNKAQKRLGLNKMSIGYATGNKLLYDEGKSAFNNADDNVIYKYPSLIKQHIADVVNKKILEESGLSEGSDIGNIREKILGANEQDYRRVMRESGFYDDPRTKEYAEELEAHPQYFADNSLVGSTKRSFTDIFKESGLGVGDMTMFRSKRDVIADKLEEEQFPKELPMGKDVPWWFTTPKKVLNTTANIAGMIAIQALTEGVGAELGLGAKAASKVGTYMSLGIPSYDNHLKESYDFIDNDAGRHLYATLGAVANAEVGKYLELDHYVNLPSTVKEKFMDVAKGLSNKTMSNETANEILNGAKKDLLNLTKNYALNVGKGALTMASFDAVNNVIKAGAGADDVDATTIMKNAGKAFIDGAIGMSLIGGVKTLQEHEQAKNSSYKAFTYDLALNHDSWEDIFKINLQRGDDTQEGFNQKMKVLNTAKAAKYALDLGIKKNGLELDSNQKKVWVANKVAVEALKNDLKEAETEEQKKGIQERIDALNEQNNQVENGLKFNNVLEPLNDLFQSSKDLKEAINEHQKGNITDEQLSAIKEKHRKLTDDYLIKNKRKSDETVKETPSEEAKVAETETEKGKSEAAKETKATPTIEELKPTIIAPSGKEYSGENHGEAMDKAREAGEDVPDWRTPEGETWRDENGGFKDFTDKAKDKGEFIDRSQALERHGIERSEDLTKPTETPNVEDWSRDVESTAKALEGKDFSKIDISDKKEYELPRPKDMKEARKYAERILKDAGLNYSFSGQSDANGKSIYFDVDGVKVRFSDHSISNKDRMQSEATFYFGDESDEIKQSILSIKEKRGDKNIEYGQFLKYKRKSDGKELKAFGFRENATPQAISEAYHKAKADGSNPELVKAVEDLLGKPKTETPKVEETKPTEPTKEQPKEVTEGETKTSSQSTDTNNRQVTGIRNKVVDAERLNRQVYPFYESIKRRWSDLWNEVHRQVSNGFIDTEKFVQDKLDEVRKVQESKSLLKRLKGGKKVILSDFENAIMLYDRVIQLNELKNREDALKSLEEQKSTLSKEEYDYANEKIKDDIRQINRKLSDAETVLRESGTATAQALASRRMMADLLGGLTSWEDYIKTQYDGNPPPEMLEKAKLYQKAYNEAQSALKDYYETQLKKAAEEEFKKGVEEGKKQAPNSENDIKKIKKTSDKLRKLSDKVRKSETLEKLGLGKPAEGAAMGATFNVKEALANALDYIAELLDKGEDLAKLISESVLKHKPEGVDEKEFTGMVKQVLADNDIYTAKDKLLKNIKDDAEAVGSTSIVKSSAKDIKSYMNMLVRDGEAKNLDELISKTKDALKDIYPDTTENEIRDLYSGYGIKNESKAELEDNVNKFKKQAKAVAEFEQLIKEPENETDLQRAKRYKRIAELKPTIEQYMAETGQSIGTAPLNREQEIKLALDNSTNRIKSLLSDLAKDFADLQRMNRDGDLESDEVKRMNKSKEEHDFIKNRMDEIVESKTLSDTDKIQRIENLLRNQKSKYDRLLREGTDPLVPKEKRIDSEQEMFLKNKVKKYDREIRTLKDEMIPESEKQTGRLLRYKEKLRNDIEKFEKRIENRDFDDTKKELKDFTKDEKALALELELHKSINNYYKLKNVADEHGQSTYKKVLDVFDHYVKFNVLSNYLTFVKLGAAVAENAVFTPIEQVASMGYTAMSHIPIVGEPLRVVMGKADRNSFLGLKQFLGTEWAAFNATFTKGFKDAWQEIRRGNSELGLIYGEKGFDDIPDEYKDTWYKVKNSLDIFARAHGAEKAIFKRNEFTRSYLLRKEAARRKGANVNDPVVQHELAAAAYNDALTSILLGDNKLANAYNGLIRKLSQSDSGLANGLGSTLRFLTPVVKIPSNLVLMGGRVGFGWLAGAEIGARAMVELAKPDSKYGLKQLDAKEADALMRNLKKGSLGLGLITLGFLRPDMFNAATFYKRGMKQEDGLEEGEVIFFGQKLPRWATDNPYFWAMKLGASMRRFYDYHRNIKEKSIPTAIGRTAVDVAAGGMAEIPMFGEFSNVTNLLENPESRYANILLYNEMTKLMPLSGLGKQLAKDTDVKTEEGKPVKRQATTLWEAIEKTYPISNREVPIKY